MGGGVNLVSSQANLAKISPGMLSPFRWVLSLIWVLPYPLGLSFLLQDITSSSFPGRAKKISSFQ